MPDADAARQISDELAVLTRELGIELQVGLGLTVSLRDLTTGEVVRYRVVAGRDVTVGDPDGEVVSVSRNSPVGHTLLNACQGQEVTVSPPTGERRFKVSRVHVEGSSEARQLVAWSLGKAADASLGKFPWVFAGDSEHALRQVRCSPSPGAGARSIQLDEPWALVAAASDTEVESWDDQPAVVDVLRIGTRRLWRVRGRVGFLTADGALTTIEAVGLVDGVSAEYELHGKRRCFDRRRTPVFLGPPALRRRQDGKLQDAVPERDLQWKSDLPGSAWRSVSSADAVLGFGTVKYVEKGVVHRAVQLCVLPEDAALEIRPSPDPRRGEVWLRGFGNVEAEVVAPSGVRAVRSNEGRDHRLKLIAEHGSPPREVVVALTWHERDDPVGQAKLTLPFPSEHVAFFGPRGQELAAGSVLTPEQLAGARVEVVAPEGGALEVQGRYAAMYPSGTEPSRDTMTLEVPATGAGRYSLDLSALQATTADALALGKDLNGVVELTVGDAQDANATRPASLAVMRFDLRLERRDADRPLLYLDQPSFDKATASELAALEVEALPLLDPTLKPVSLERASRASWRPPDEQFAPGPYLVVGCRESRQRLWPLIWQAPSRQHTSLRPQSVEEAHATAAGEFSSMAFRSVALRMGADLDHGDWKLVFGYLRERSLPVQVFPLLQGLAETPRGCATAAFRASDQEFDLLWERMEELRFAWWQVPHCCWRDALDAYAEHSREEMSPLGTDGFLPGLGPDRLLPGFLFDDRRHRDLVESRIGRIKTRLDGLDEAFDSWATDAGQDRA